jgi:phospholipid transport system substrate-binding protein
MRYQYVEEEMMVLITRKLYFVKTLVVLSVIFMLATPSGAVTTPMALVKEKADQVMNILNDPALKNNKEKRRQLVMNVVEGLIDWQEVGKRALAQHWRKRTPQEKEEFVVLFHDLLKRTYSEKLDLYGGEKIVYESETIDGNRATVKTRVINSKKGEEFLVEYRLLKKGERWLGYDLIIEGISAVNNYRTQFNEVITGSSYDALIKKMKSKAFRVKESQKDTKGTKK